MGGAWVSWPSRTLEESVSTIDCVRRQASDSRKRAGVQHVHVRRSSVRHRQARNASTHLESLCGARLDRWLVGSVLIKLSHVLVLLGLGHALPVGWVRSEPWDVERRHSREELK